MELSFAPMNSTTGIHRKMELIFRQKKPVGTRGWECGYTTESFYAGFPHLYFYSNPEIAEHFVKQAQSWREAIWEIQKE